MGGFRYFHAIVPVLCAAQVYGWGGWGNPPPDVVWTTVQATYTQVVQETAPYNGNPVKEDYAKPNQYPTPTQYYGGPPYGQSPAPVGQSPAPVGQSPAPVGQSSAPIGPPAGSSLPGGVPPASSVAVVPQPSGSTVANSCGSNVQKISLENKSGVELVVQAGPPWTVGQCGNIANGATCTFCQQRGSTGGNLQFGAGTANARGTWIEGNWDTDVQWATVDVSFIPGYSVPISCTSDLTGATNGWSSPLCTDSSCSNCNSGGGSWDGNACENPAGAANNPLPNGPCPSFFSSSAGGAYCFPNDNGVVGFGQPWSSVSCVAGAQSGGGASKRDANDTLVEREMKEKSAVLEARHPVRLSGHGGARVHARNLKL